MDGTGTPKMRQQMVLEYVNEHGSAQIREMSVLYQVSEATIRRDLDELASSGYLERVHGGAMRVSSTTFESYHSEKMKTMLPEKKRIAAYAASLVKNGDSIFLDSGTTTYFIAQNLANHTDLTIITNNLDIACSLEFHATTSLIVTGGLRRSNYSVLIGTLAEQSIQNFYVDLAFMGCDAVSPRSGVFNTNFLEIGVKKQIVGCGKKTALVTDRSKFYRQALAKVCDLSEIDLVITDDGLEEQTAEEIRAIVPNTVCV